MKKIIAIIMVILVITLTGCGAAQVNETTELITQESTTKIETTQSVNVTYQFDKEDESFNYGKGDINKDKYINSLDEDIIASYLDGVYQFDEEEFNAADMNDDGKVDNEDYTAIINIVKEGK